MNFYIADLHFGHQNIMAFDNRPFPDINTHDNVLIENWNNVVDIDDDVYILGDISWHNSTKTIEIFKQLNGNKHLIVGNHDKKLLRNQKLRSLFVEITDYKEITTDDGSGIVLCHYPIPCFNNHYYGWVHIYGHVHNSWEWEVMEDVKEQLVKASGENKPCRMYNAGCMLSYMGYAPRTLSEILNACEK